MPRRPPRPVFLSFPPSLPPSFLSLTLPLSNPTYIFSSRMAFFLRNCDCPPVRILGVPRHAIPSLSPFSRFLSASGLAPFQPSGVCVGAVRRTHARLFLWCHYSHLSHITHIAPRTHASIRRVSTSRPPSVGGLSVVRFSGALWLQSYRYGAVVWTARTLGFSQQKTRPAGKRHLIHYFLTGNRWSENKLRSGNSQLIIM